MMTEQRETTTSLLNPSVTLIRADAVLRAQRALDEATSALMIAKACASHSVSCACGYCVRLHVEARNG